MKLWIKALVWLPLVCVAFASCGDDDAKKVAHAGAGEGGAAGAADPTAGGSDSMPATSGMGGVPAPGTSGSAGAEGGTGALVMGGGGQVGQAALVCNWLDLAGAGGLGVGGDPYGGAEWADFAADVCKSCPSVLPSCYDLEAAGSSYDPATGVLTVQVPPGTTELVSADFQYSYDTGQGMGTGTVAAVVEENTLSYQIGAIVGEAFQYFRGGFDLVDRCGDTADTDMNLDVLDVELIPSAGGAPSEPEYQVRCHNLD